MIRPIALAGALAGLWATALTGAVAAVGDKPQAREVERVLDAAGANPVVRPASATAKRGGLSRSQLRSRLRTRMSAVGGASGAWVYDLDAGRKPVLFSDAGSRRRMLASNSKLFATAPALARFGADGRFATRLWARGERRGPGDRVLRGSLVLAGAGDPALASPSFARRNGLPLTRLRPLATRVRKAGIRKVAGPVIADDTIFDRRRSVPQRGITGGPYLSPLSGLSFDSGFDGGRFASDPARVAGRELVRLLRAKGVRVTGEVRVRSTPAGVRRRKPLGKVRSPRVANLIAATNKPSNNFFAEMVLKRIAASAARRGTTRRGVAKAERFARKLGSGASLRNGSGLSRSNVASPKEVGRLLIGMSRQPKLARPFRRSLAVAGRDGTLARRMRGTAAEGECQGKTGSLDGVSVLSGYCEAGRRRIAFSILMNGVDLDAARRAQDGMVAAIARYRR